MTKKVSIIVPIYGVERYIERCAKSLFEQTYPNIEYVFVNDATPDKSMDVLRQVIARYPVRQKDVRIITHSQNKGLSAARNTGLNNSTGEFVWHVDSDDYIALNAVEQLVETAKKQKAEIVVFDVNVVTDKGIKIEEVHYTNKIDYISRLLQHTEKCAHWNKFYRRSLLDSTGICCDENIRLAEDYAVTPRLIHEAQTIAELHEPLYFYETRNQSSYVHNLKRAAIESQYRADKILTEWFSHVQDAEQYRDVIEVLSARSMVSLIKNSDLDGWKEILDVYKDELSLSGKQMTFVNRIIFYLAKYRRLLLLRFFMGFYHCVMRDRK